MKIGDPKKMKEMISNPKFDFDNFSEKDILSWFQITGLNGKSVSLYKIVRIFQTVLHARNNKVNCSAMALEHCISFAVVAKYVDLAKDLFDLEKNEKRNRSYDFSPTRFNAFTRSEDERSEQFVRVMIIERAKLEKQLAMINFLIDPNNEEFRKEADKYLSKV